MTILGTIAGGLLINKYTALMGFRLTAIASGILLASLVIQSSRNDLVIAVLGPLLEPLMKRQSGQFLIACALVGAAVFILAGLFFSRAYDRLELQMAGKKAETTTVNKDAAGGRDLQARDPASSSGAPPAQQKNVSRNDEPRITGRIDQAYFYSLPRPATSELMILWVLLKVHLSNDGRTTVIQGFRLVASLVDADYASDPVDPALFRLVGTGAPEKVTDLRESNNIPLARHDPRDGWLAFKLREQPGEFNVKSNATLRKFVKRLTLTVVDGANQPHEGPGVSPPFTRPYEIVTASGQPSP